MKKSVFGFFVFNIFFYMESNAVQDKNAKFFSKYPAKATLESCAKPDLNSDKRAKKFKTNIRRNIKEKDPLRFAGDFGVIINSLTGGSDWFVYRCKDGKIVSILPIAALDILVRPDSRGIIANPDNTENDAFGPPKYFIWDGEKFIEG